jgi:hypothetical protein
MTTHALDIASLLHAMRELAEKVGDNADWHSVNADTGYVIEMLRTYGQVIAGSQSIKALASADWEALNRFLVSNNFRPAIKQFDPGEGIGVVSILDKLLKWKSGPARKTTISTIAGSKPGFILPSSDVAVYRATGFLGFLIRIPTRSADTLWIYLPDKNEAYISVLDRLHLVELTFALSAADHFAERGKFTGVTIPMLEFSLEPDISFMLGAELRSDSEVLVITQAGQQFKLRMDETGARVKTESHLVTERGIVRSDKPLVVDRPFIGWFTEEGAGNLPMASFFADFDSWKQPAGSLQDL